MERAQIVLLAKDKLWYGVFFLIRRFSVTIDATLYFLLLNERPHMGI